MSVRVHINLHERLSYPRPGGYVEYGLGKILYSEEWEMPECPREGELITAHDQDGPNEHSWTGRVTGVQWVLKLGQVPVAVVTVRNGE